MEEWKIDRIDTSDVAEAFAKELRTEPKTYFLQGEWGSGKTEYLKEVEKSAEKDLKFIYLELWKPKDKASLAQKILESIYPKFYLIKVFFYVCAIILPIWASTYISIITITHTKITNTRLPLIAIIAILITTVVAYCQNKLFDMNRFMLWLDKANLRWDTYPKFVVDKYCNINGPIRVETKLCPKVLVVDDFDRLDSEVQDELYLFFNQLNGRVRIIFVGDFEKLSKDKAYLSKDKAYLSKIIDREIALPIQLQSKNISKSIENKIRYKMAELEDKNYNYSYINTRDFAFDEIAKLFISENRTARDANQYLYYIENQLISRKKLDRVNLTQELFVIYLFLFDRKKYNMLLNGYKPIPERYTLAEKKQEPKSKIEKLMDFILFTKDTVEVNYENQPKSYLIDSLATNHTISELIDISKDREDLKVFFTDEKQSSKDYKEYYSFLQNLSFQDFPDNLSFIAKVAIEVVASPNYKMPNGVLRVALNRRLVASFKERKKASENNLLDKERKKYKKSADAYVITQFEKTFSEAQKESGQALSNGKKLHLYRTLVGLFSSSDFSYDAYAQNYFKNIVNSAEKEEDFGNKRFDSEAILYQLGFNYAHLGYSKFHTKNPPSVESKVKIIENLCDEEYLYFWSLYLTVYNEYPIEFARNVEIGDLSEYKPLQFSYKGENYAKHVLERYRSNIDKQW